MRSTIACIAACWLALASGSSAPVRPPAAGAASGSPASAADPADRACLRCHASAAGVLAGPMATRTAERAFAARAFGNHGARFFERSCMGCHLTRCSDCHGDLPHGAGGRPGNEACLRCHRGSFVGWEYLGRAPREDHVRYQRGPQAQGEHYLTMLPDIHAERGLVCGDCHTMRSLQEGRRTAKTCLDCHPTLDRDVPEHAIVAHLDRMECWSCHSAWGAQEYGTFLVRGLDDDAQEVFDAALPAWGDWRRSAYLRRQDAPPLGRNAAGRISPIRPQFVLFATDPARGWENRLLVAEWKPFFPHTVRRGTVACGACHEAPRRYLLEDDADRHYLLEKDGLSLRSFWSQDGQSVIGGAFVSRAEHDRMNRKTPEYVRRHLERWQRLLDRAGWRSAR